jgi:hypothetical protein
VRDPTERPPGSWPRDRPVRWGRLADNVTWFLLGSAAAVIQILLVIPLLGLVLTESSGWGVVVQIAATLVWAGLTLFAAWSWVLGRWRVVAAPFVTIAVLWLASTLLG